MTCHEIRDLLALQPSIEEPQIEQHLEQCGSCAKYRRQHQSLDVLLRAEMHWEAPAALTARLLALASAPDQILSPTGLAAQPLAAGSPASRSAGPIAAPRPQLQPWFLTAVYVLTIAIIGLSLLIGWQVIGSLTSQVGLGAVVTQLLALPGQGLAYINRVLPESRYLIDFFMRVRVQLLWLLVVAVLWAVLDKVDLRFSFRGRQISL